MIDKMETLGTKGIKVNLIHLGSLKKFKFTSPGAGAGSRKKNYVAGGAPPPSRDKFF